MPLQNLGASVFTLKNYWSYPEIVILGAAWTLAIEIIFYALTFALLPTLKKSPCAAITIQIAIIFSIYAVRENFGNGFFLFSACAAYLIVGQAAYFLYNKPIKIKALLVLLLLLHSSALAGIWLIHTAFPPTNNSYLINFSYAHLIFITQPILKDKLRTPALIHRLADSSYSIYLPHGTIGGTTIALIVKYTGSHSTTIIFLTSLVATALSILAAWIFFLLVKKPSIKAARNLCRMINTRPLKLQKDQT